jgi:HEAT repeat protein
MKRMRHVAWLTTHRELLLELDGRAQAVAVDLAVASDINRGELFDFLVCVLADGLAEGRRASCQALAKFEDRKADEVVIAAVSDPDAGVRAAAVRQLRPRKLPDALQRLVGLLDSPSVEVRDAARSSLAEFNFVRYRAMFDLLDDGAARTTGMLVQKVDYSARQKLVEELTSPSLSSRLRGIEMAVAMAATDDVEPQLIELAVHENVEVRKEAINALGYCTGSNAVEILKAATGDANPSVAESARQSLARRGMTAVQTSSSEVAAMEQLA